MISDDKIIRTDGDNATAVKASRAKIAFYSIPIAIYRDSAEVLSVRDQRGRRTLPVEQRHRAALQANQRAWRQQLERDVLVDGRETVDAREPARGSRGWGPGTPRSLRNGLHMR